MADNVKGMEEIRASLPSILATLRRTPGAEPVHFGSHRREEAVQLSRERYEQQSAAVRELEELERIGALQLVRTDSAMDGSPRAPSMRSSTR